MLIKNVYNNNNNIEKKINKMHVCFIRCNIQKLYVPHVEQLLPTLPKHQIIQWPKEEGQTKQWPKDNEQKDKKG
jgi:hypothetical protein